MTTIAAPASGYAAGDILLNFPHQPTAGGLTSLLLRPGVIDANVVEAFTNGYCYYLARALHEINGAPFAVIEHHHDDDGRGLRLGRWCGEWWWTHVGLLVDGQFLDVEGLRPVGDVICRDQRCRVTLRDTLLGLYDVVGWDDGVESERWDDELRLGPLGAFAVRRLAYDVLAAAGLMGNAARDARVDQLGW